MTLLFLDKCGRFITLKPSKTASTTQTVVEVGKTRRNTQEFKHKYPDIWVFSISYMLWTMPYARATLQGL